MKLLFRSRFPSLRHLKLHTRYFSYTSPHRLRTTELQDSNFSSLRTDASRLWADIHNTAEFGKGKVYGELLEQSGLARLALSQSDKQARDWFVQTTKDLGCDVQIDKIGNIFAVRKGLRNDVAPTFAGSHLDSQPNGGRFDGVLGVCAGVEMLRVLNDNWIETEGPVGVVNWTNEEGARWRKSMMGSGIWAGVHQLEQVYEMTDSQGVSVKDALEDIEYMGEVGVADNSVKMAGHFELHIEQGRVLEREQEKVAIVSGVQAYKWFTVTVEGQEGHAGATAWEDRCDAMRIASSLFRGFYKAAAQGEGLVTIGSLWIDGGSVNTIPGKVSMTLDARHRTDAGLKKLQFYLYGTVLATQGQATKDYGTRVKITMTEDFASQAIEFNRTAMGCVREGAKNVLDRKEEVRTMKSGAGHDSVNTNLLCPTAMIFVRCKEGITHNPEEWCSQEDAKVGTDVLIESVLRFDRSRLGSNVPGAISLDREM